MVSILYSLTDNPATTPVHATSQDIISEVSDTSVNTDDGIFNTNYVFLIIIVLIGVFVLFFSVCVITYTYFKCFRRNINTNEIKENELQANYKSLDFEAMQSEATGHQANIEQRRFISDSSYLSPVFVRNESQIETRDVPNNEIRCVNHEIVPEPEFNTQNKANKETIAILPSSDLTEHVYIEITEDVSDLESANLTADDGLENKKNMDIRRTETLCRDSRHINESK